MNKYARALVIDSSHTARSIITTERAFAIFYKGNAEVIHNHPESFKLVKKDIDYKKPSVIKVASYIKMSYQKVPLNRENIYKRDEWKCVYCPCTDKSQFTIDHVIPKAHGGGNTWENMVTACKTCNGEKADLTLEEYGKEIPDPKRPHYLMLLKNQSYIPDEWRHYLFF